MGADVVAHVQENCTTRYEQAAFFSSAMAFATSRALPAPLRVTPESICLRVQCRHPVRRAIADAPGGRGPWQVPASTQLLVLNLTSLAWSVIAVLV